MVMQSATVADCIVNHYDSVPTKFDVVHHSCQQSYADAILPVSRAQLKYAGKPLVRPLSYPESSFAVGFRSWGGR